jgi:hypothetical protein
MAGVNDFKTIQMFHKIYPPRTAFNPEVYEKLKAEGYVENYKHVEYPKAMYPPNYHSVAKQVVNKNGEPTGEWIGFRTIKVVDLKGEQDLRRKGWLDHMPPLPGDGVENFAIEVVEDFSDPVLAAEAKKAHEGLAQVAARNTTLAAHRAGTEAPAGHKGER